MATSAAYTRLRNAFKTVGCTNVLSGLHQETISNDKIDYLNHYRKSSAKALGMYLLEQGLIEFVLRNSDEYEWRGDKEMTAMVRILPPGDPDVTARETELKEARAEGREQILAEFAREASRLKSLDMYGPAIGNAISHFVETLRRRKW